MVRLQKTTRWWWVMLDCPVLPMHRIPSVVHEGQESGMGAGHFAAWVVDPDDTPLTVSSACALLPQSSLRHQGLLYSTGCVAMLDHGWAVAQVQRGDRDTSFPIQIQIQTATKLELASFARHGTTHNSPTMHEWMLLQQHTIAQLSCVSLLCLRAGFQGVECADNSPSGMQCTGARQLYYTSRWPSRLIGP